jgi:hypothetical protein
VGVPLQRLHAGLGLVVPHLDELVVRAAHQKGAVAACGRGVCGWGGGEEGMCAANDTSEWVGVGVVGKGRRATNDTSGGRGAKKDASDVHDARGEGGASRW